MDKAIENRLSALRDTATWIEENYPDADNDEIAKNLGMMKGDIYVLLREL